MTARAGSNAPNIFFFAVIVSLLALAVILGAHPRRGADLRVVYLVAAERFWDAEPLYRDSDGGMPFKYAPPSAWFFTPLLAFPVRAATVIWNVLTVALLAWSVQALSRILQLTTREARLGAAFALLALAQPLFLELHYAQVNGLMLALFVGAQLCATRERSALAGLLLACACALKPIGVLICVLWVVQRRFRALGFAALFGAGLWLTTILRYGLDGTLELIRAWTALVSRTTAPWVLGHNPQGLPTLLLEPFYGRDVTPPPDAFNAAQLGAIGLVALVLLLVRPSARVLWAAAVMAIALVSPHAWRHNYILALPLMMLALTSGKRAGLALVVLCGAVSAVVFPELLGADTYRDAMFLRPFALAYVALFGWAVFALAHSPSPQTK